MARRKLFISYSHADAHWLVLIRKHLSVLEAEGLVDAVDDSVIQAGEDWYAKLDREMLESNIAVLLISASYLSSPFVLTQEIPRLLNRHKQGGMLLYPLLIRHCAWQVVSWLKPLQIRPISNRPVSSFAGAARDKCLADMALEIASTLKSWGETPGTVIIRHPQALSPADFTVWSSGSEITVVINWFPPLVRRLAHSDGVWKFQFHLESIGSGPVFAFPRDPISKRSAQLLLPDGSCQYEFKIPAEFAPPGKYKAVLTYQYDGIFDFIEPIVGFTEGPIVSIT